MLKFIREDPLVLLILALPLAFLAEIGHWGELWVFILSALGVIPMAHASHDHRHPQNQQQVAQDRPGDRSFDQVQQAFPDGNDRND